jgi:hypothetical protein
MKPFLNLNRCAKAELACGYALQALSASEAAVAQSHIGSCEDIDR